MKRFNVIVGLTLALSLLLCGCHGQVIKAPDPTYQVDQAAVQTGAYLDAASRSLEGLKAKLAVELQAWVSTIQDLLKQGQLQVDATRAANEAERIEKGKVIVHAQAVEKENTDLKHSWGHRLQMGVTGGFWVLVGLVAFHYLGLVLGLLIPGPAGMILSVGARVVNPGAWATSLADNVWFRRVQPNQPAPGGGKV